MKEAPGFDGWGIFATLAGLSVPPPIQLHKEKSGILAQLQSTLAHRPGTFWATMGVAGVSLFGMVAAFGTVAEGAAVGLFAQKQVVESLPLPATLMAEPLEAEAAGFLHEERVQRGDTVAELLQRLGVNDREALEFLRQNASTQLLFRQLSPGKNLTARTTQEGGLQTLVFPLNGGKDMALVVERQDKGFAAKEQPLQLETQVVMKSAEVRHSLFGASDAAGIPDSVATALADIFGGDIDFHRDLRRGDRFAVIYESITHLGRAVRSGRILAAEFTNNGKTYRAAWFADPVGGENAGGYYTADGKSIRKAFLRSPLEFSRITSGFTTARFHPVLQKWRAHKGIDYGAPTGTRIKATGDGVVDFVGVKGGYGKVVVLRHQSRYTTLYGHLSGFASGLRKGNRVNQGDIIGFVGATGLASGPHLHYEFRIGDVHQNPLAIALPSAPPLTAQQLGRFKVQTESHLARLDLIRSLNLAQVD